MDQIMNVKSFTKTIFINICLIKYGFTVALLKINYFRRKMNYLRRILILTTVINVYSKY